MNRRELKDKPAVLKKKRGWVLYSATIIFSLLFLFFGNKVATAHLMTSKSDETRYSLVKAKVLEVTESDSDEYSPYEGTTITNVQLTFSARILNGAEKGKIVSANQGIQYINNEINKMTPAVEPGDKVLIRFYEAQRAIEWQFVSFIRTDALLILGIIFIIALLIYGRFKGLNTIISLAFTCGTVFAVFIPSVLSGINIYFSSIVVCMFTIIMTFIIVNGGNKKTLTATLGCLSGIIAAGVLTIIMSNILKLTGFVDEGSFELTYLATKTPIDLTAIIFAAILIGALGAIMDVSMSIASALWELKEKPGTITFRELFQSGMNIGKDIMGTMANTLILAYIGSSLVTVLLLTTSSTSLTFILNKELVIVEILQTLVGSFGLLFTLPLTSLISAALYTKKVQ